VSHLKTEYVARQKILSGPCFRESCGDGSVSKCWWMHSLTLMNEPMRFFPTNLRFHRHVASQPPPLDSKMKSMKSIQCLFQRFLWLDH